MKLIRVIIALSILAGYVIAEKSHEAVIIDDFDNTVQGFSFSKGELIRSEADAENLSIEIDFILDMPNGLGMNNSQLSDWFSGQAMILDLGEIPLKKLSELPDEDFAAFLLPEDILSGHTYLIQTADTEHYAMIKIVNFDSENSQLTFNWISVDQ